MTLVWEINATTLGVFALQSIFLIVFLVRTHDTAKSAKQLAEDLRKHVDGQLAVLTASIALVREQYAHKDDLGEMEKRITGAINQLAARLDAFLIKRAGE